MRRWKHSAAKVVALVSRDLDRPALSSRRKTRFKGHILNRDPYAIVIVSRRADGYSRFPSCGANSTNDPKWLPALKPVKPHCFRHILRFCPINDK